MNLVSLLHLAMKVTIFNEEVCDYSVTVDELRIDFKKSGIVKVPLRGLPKDSGDALEEVGDSYLKKFLVPSKITKVSLDGEVTTEYYFIFGSLSALVDLIYEGEEETVYVECWLVTPKEGCLLFYLRGTPPFGRVTGIKYSLFDDPFKS